MKIIPVILSGGSGSRLWPLSRKHYPKQYLSLNSDNTIFQETISRLSGLENIESPIIVCNKEHRFFVAEQLTEISINNAIILTEPNGRNTAPAIAAAAIQALDIYKNQDVSLLILPSDHLINDKKAFHEAINLALSHSSNGKLVTFGIMPNSPNTEYGYIRASKITKKNQVSRVLEFKEKPNLEAAESYIQKGNYFWNSGMFIFQPKTLINELHIHAKDVYIAVKESIDNATKDLDFICLEENFFNSSPNISIDYALMEKSENVVNVELNAGWNDIGSWSSLYEISKKDKNGNVFKGDVINKASINTYVNASHHMIATIGVEDLVIVDTPDATLIANRFHAKEVKNIVNELQQKSRQEQIQHRKVYRPWGWYDSIEKSKYFQVKRLQVNPGAKISLQLHSHRSEHWVVVGGTGIVTNGDEKITLKKGMSTYIPVGVKHSLENKTNKPLEIIEVQSGTYLGEDDIVRFEDIYGRIKDF